MAIGKQLAGDRQEGLKPEDKKTEKPFDESPGNQEWVDEFAKEKVEAEGEDLDQLDDYLPEVREDEIELVDDVDLGLHDALEDLLIAFMVLNPTPTDEQIGQLAGAIGTTKEELEYHVNTLFGHLAEEAKEGETASTEIEKIDP